MSPIITLSFISFLFVFSIILKKHHQVMTVLFFVASTYYFIKYNLNASLLILFLFIFNIVFSSFFSKIVKKPLFPLAYVAILIFIKKYFGLNITGFSYIVIAASMDIALINRDKKKMLESFLNLFSFPKTLIGPIANLTQHQYRAIDESAFFCLFKGIIKAFLLLNLYRTYAPLEIFQQFSPTINFLLLGLWQYFNLYLEFSGYSDIVYGIYRCLQKDCPVNFNRPYMTTTLKDFWNRWHMSLGSFIKNHIYIPLGGNRYGTIRTYINLIIAMILCGLWHGITFNFALWGLMQGIGLCLEKLLNLEEKIKNIYLRWIIVQLYVTLSWSVFFS